MKAAVYYENGDPSVLKYEDVPNPVCHPKGVLVRVEAISIEGGDVLNRFAGPLATRPHIVGYQAGGEVIEVGADVTGFKVGDKVATCSAYGSHAELRSVPARAAWHIPAGFDVGKASVMPVAFGTADDCLFEFGHLKAGQTVLIQAGASGVGVAAIQLAKRAGATVLATASSDERLEKLRRLGMDHGINYATHDVAKEVMRLTDKKGVNLVVDPIGGSTLESSIRSLGYRGRVCLVGGAGREGMKIDAMLLMGGNQVLQGVYLTAELARGSRAYDNIQRLIDEAAAGEIEVLIDRVFPLSQAAEAHAYIESRKAVGRVLMVP